MQLVYHTEHNIIKYYIGRDAVRESNIITLGRNNWSAASVG